MATFDPNVPSIARVYDYLLGGKDNFPADRELAERFMAIVPDVAPTMRDNRQFLARAVSWVAGQGVAQFLDLGCGLPTEPNTGGSAREVDSDARVVYVDRDPVVVNHLIAVVGKEPGTTVVAGDVSDTATILAEAATALDLAQPTCLVMGALVHFYPADAARALVSRYLEALAPGSYLVLSCARIAGEKGEQAVRAYNSGGTRIYPHSDDEIASFFDSATLTDPGLTEVKRWRAGWTGLPDVPPRAGEMIGGVALRGGRLPCGCRPGYIAGCTDREGADREGKETEHGRGAERRPARPASRGAEATISSQCRRVRGSALPDKGRLCIIVAKQLLDGRRADDAAVDRAAAPPLGPRTDRPLRDHREARGRSDGAGVPRPVNGGPAGGGQDNPGRTRRGGRLPHQVRPRGGGGQPGERGVHRGGHRGGLGR